MLQFKLRPYQQKVYEWLKPKACALLYLKMRLGKCLIMIRRIKTDLNPQDKILIISPIGAFQGWKDDLKREGFEALEIWHYNNKKRKELFFNNINNYQFFLINKEFDRVFPEISSYNWKYVIWDEIHYIKDPKTNISKFTLKHFNHVPNKFGLSGTPKGKKDLDYFQQLKFVDDSIDIDFWKFRAVYFISRQFKFFLTVKGKKWLDEHLEKNAYFLTREQAGIKIKTRHIIRKIILPADIRKVYEHTLETWELAYKGHTQSTKWILTQFLYLQYLCGGADKETIYHHAKIKEVLTLLKSELLNEQVVIWAKFKPEIQLLYKTLSHHKHKVNFINGDVPLKKKKQLIKDFQDKKFNIFILQPKAVQEGVKLSAASSAIYYSMPAGDISFNQSIDRILDIKTSSGLMIFYIVCKNTVDEDIVDGTRKQKNLNEIMFNYLDRSSK